MENGAELIIAPARAGGVIPQQAESDEHCIRLWLDGHRSDHTRRAYQTDLGSFFAVVRKPLRQVTLGDVQTYAESITHLAPASRARKLAALKSLFTFGHRIGFLPFDVGAPIRLPAVKNVLAERILEQNDVVRLIALEPVPRNHALLRLLYLAGLRLSEAIGLHWRDVKRRTNGGQVTVFGKGGKTRVILLPPSLWKELAGLRGDAGDNDPVFLSRKGGPLQASQVHRIVKEAAQRAGLSGDVSAHWLRHAHASHSLDAGCPPHVLQATLGHASLATTSRYSHAKPNESSSKYLAG